MRTTHQRALTQILTTALLSACAAETTSQGTPCTEGARRCLGDIVQTCRESVWEDLENCASGGLECSNGECSSSCQAATCESLNKQCGTWDDNCAGSVTCGPCSSGTCNTLTGQCEASCTPQTCQQLGKQCGTWPDGCSGQVTCSPCATGTCNTATGQCQVTCTPATCASLGKACGQWSNGCGEMITCGPCASGTCNTATGQCQTTCVPLTCVELGKECGAWANGCGGTVTCGPCASGTCNTATGDCQVSCDPLTCEELSRECGTWDDGCGNGITCGPCASGTCNTATGQCEVVCVPETCGSLAKQCGTWDNGCAGTLTCGPCSAGTCNTETGQCEVSCTPDCSGRVCGPDPDCGESCGDCAVGACNAAGQCVGEAGDPCPVAAAYTAHPTAPVCGVGLKCLGRHNTTCGCSEASDCSLYSPEMNPYCDVNGDCTASECAAPCTAGTCPVGYRVRDDDGCWCMRDFPAGSQGDPCGCNGYFLCPTDWFCAGRLGGITGFCSAPCPQTTCTNTSSCVLTAGGTSQMFCGWGCSLASQCPDGGEGWVCDDPAGNGSFCYTYDPLLD